jgi:basic membrane protein A and related proteins
MRRKYVWSALVVGLAVGALALAGGSAAKPQAAFKVAWIYPGPHNDHGWSQAHDAGRLYVQKMLGSKVQTTYKENIFSNAQVPQVVAGLVRQGYNMIFATSFGMLENGVNGQLWKKYPNVKFEQATGTEIQKNQSEYFGAAEDTIYLSGMAAGAASKKGQIGYIVPFGTPEVVRHLNAFTLGAQATHPGAKVKIIWTTAWYSPPKETAAATNLIASGVDVLGQNVDSDAAGVYAEKKGIPWVGYDSNAKASAPKQWLTASVYNWGLYYLKRVKAAMNGTWKPGFYYGSINDGFTKLAPYGPKVSAKTKRLIAAKQRAIQAGKFNPFQGPLYDQKGKLMVPKGKTLKVLPDLYSMQWLVKGVQGSISKVPPP